MLRIPICRMPAYFATIGTSHCDMTPVPIASPLCARARQTDSPQSAHVLARKIHAIHEKRYVTAKNDMRGKAANRFGFDAVQNIAEENLERGLALDKRTLVKSGQDLSGFDVRHKLSKQIGRSEERRVGK